MARDARRPGGRQGSPGDHGEISGVLRRQGVTPVETASCCCTSSGSALLPAGRRVIAPLQGMETFHLFIGLVGLSLVLLKLAAHVRFS